MACISSTWSRITGPRKLPKRGSGRRASRAASKSGLNRALTIGLVARCPYSLLKFSQWVVREQILADHPVQVMIKNTSTIRQHIERPRLISIN